MTKQAEAIEWLIRQPPQYKMNPATANFIFEEGGVWELKTDYCHRYLSVDRNTKHMASMVRCRLENLDVFNKAWAWITSPICPWFSLSNMVTLVRDKNDMPLYWEAGEDFFKAHSQEMIKNFSILTRQLYEKEFRWKLWARLVDDGLDPREAFYVASFFYPLEARPDEYYFTYADMSSNGAHWPINDHATYYAAILDWYLYWNGIPRQKVDKKGHTYCQVNQFCVQASWAEKNKYIPFNNQDLKTKIVKTSFDRLEAVVYESIIPAFRKWAEKMKIDERKKEYLCAPLK